MPSKSTSARRIAYVALSPPKQQTTFPNRRRSVKHSPALPKLNKDQSTLTQIGFGTPSAQSEIVSISSGDEIEEPRPKKKRKQRGKFDGRKADQSTMTQFQRGEFPRSTSRGQKIELDEDGFQIWEDSDFEEEMRKDQAVAGNIARATTGSSGDDGNENDELEIPETSQPYVVSSQATERSIEKKANEIGGTYQTPRKVRFTEVPSSQTPPSTKLSTQRSGRTGAIQRSPLKEKSVNLQDVSSSQQSPESQNITMKMLEKVRFATREAPLNDAMDRPPSPGQEDPVENATDFESIRPATPDHRPPLKRAATVQDSEPHDLGVAGVLGSRIVDERPRKLRRVHTVQDSQIDDLDLEEPVCVLDDGDDNFEESQFYDYGSNDSNFDPANSALDRDAARFRWTQTQTQARLDRIEEGDDSETDDEDLDLHHSHNNPYHEVSPTAETSQNIDKLSQRQQPPTEEPEANQIQITPRAAAKRSTAHGASVCESEDVAPQAHDLPSSPPAPRPSQVSTVVPSPQRSSSPIQGAPCPASNSASQAPTVSSPTQRSSINFIAEPFSDSPLEIPPWSSPEKANWASKENINDAANPQSGGHLDSLMDFSLPPPPPLPSSSRRQTPASSLS